MLEYLTGKIQGPTHALLSILQAFRAEVCQRYFISRVNTQLQLILTRTLSDRQ